MGWNKFPQGTNPPEKRYGVAGGNKWVEEFTGTNSYNPKYPHARCINGATPVTPDHLVIYGGCLG